MLSTQFEVKFPVEFAGMRHFEYYVLGTDEAMNVIVPNAMGTRSFKKALKQAQVPPSNDINQLTTSAVGSELLISVICFEEKEGPYAGTSKNRITGYYKLGEKEPKIDVVSGRGQVVGAPVAPSLPTMSNVPAPAAVANNVYPGSHPITTAAIAPSGSIGVPPVQPRPLGVTTPTQPVQQTPVNTAPPETPQPVAIPQPLVKCTICQADIPMNGYSEHMQLHVKQMGI